MSIRSAPRRGYWLRNLRLVSVLLTMWLLVSVLPWAFATLPINATVLGWPLPFAFAAFGVPLIYLLLIGVYAQVMARRDARFLEDRSIDPLRSDKSTRDV